MKRTWTKATLEVAIDEAIGKVKEQVGVLEQAQMALDIADEELTRRCARVAVLQKALFQGDWRWS